jgi:hypothetical protein
LREFVKEYLRACRAHLTNLLQPNQEIVIFWIGNSYASFTYSNILSQYIQVKKARL